MLTQIKQFFTPSTAKALKGFSKAVSQLKQVAEHERAEADRQALIASRASDARTAATARWSEANRLATKISEFIA